LVIHQGIIGFFTICKDKELIGPGTGRQEEIDSYLYLMITPGSLKKGDMIGIVAPARKIEEHEIAAFVAKIDEWGFRYKTGKHLYGSYHQFSGSDKERAADMQAMIDDKQVKAIICARGGYGSIRTLPLLDFSALGEQPKWIAGFSDITVYHAYINTFTGIETLHAMMPLNFSNNYDEESAETLRKALTGEKLEYSFSPHRLNTEGEAEGELTGGNLSMLLSLNGTAWFPDLRNKILFIEDVDEYLYHIDRIMMNLLHSGVFNKIKGLVCGGFTKMNDNDIPFGKNAEEIIAGITSKFNIPVCFGFPAGHQLKNKTLIFGRQTRLRVKEGTCSLKFNS